MIALLFIGILLVGIPAFAQVIEKPDLKRGTTVADKIFAIEDSAMEEWRKGNPLKWIEISAEDVIYIDPGLAAPIVGRKAYLDYLTPLKGKILYDGSEYVDPKVVINGDIAVLTYNYHSLNKDKAGRMQRSSFWNTTEVYRKIAGSWKIIHTHWSYIQHSLPENLDLTVSVLKKETASQQGDEALIINMENAALKRYRTGDPTGYLEIYAPDVTYYDSGTPGRVNGLEEMKKLLIPRTGKIRYDFGDFVERRLHIYGDTAVYYFRYLSGVLNPDGTIKKRTPWNCTEVYAKIGGQWKIIHSHWSFIKGERKDSGV